MDINMGIKVAIFGDCLIRGGVSHFELMDNGKLNGKVGVGFRERNLRIEPKRYSVIIQLQKSYDVIDYSNPRIATSYKGGESLKKSILYNILNTDLIGVDVIIIQCSVNDYRKAHGYGGETVLGDYDSEDPYTILGAFNLIIKELKTKYPTKKVIFVLPVYGKCTHIDISFEEYLDILKEKFVSNGYHYISGYDFFKNAIPKDYKISHFLPDKVHLDLNAMFLFVDYAIEEIKKIINS